MKNTNELVLDGKKVSSVDDKKLAPSYYYDSKYIKQKIQTSGHRFVIGDMWEEVGALQFQFLCSHGLKPDHYLLDVGCGSLRGGVRFIDYLKSFHYYGIDINQSLLDAGWCYEILNTPLESKLPKSHLVKTSSFEFDLIPQMFDYALAVSLFSHLPGNIVVSCLKQLSYTMKPGGVFFATFFIVDEEDACKEGVKHDRGDVITFASKDPFHYSESQINAFVEKLAIKVDIDIIGDWEHPRNQKMVKFTFQ